MLLPLRDTTGGHRAPVATLALVAALAALHAVTLGGGWELLHLAADALLLWILGPTLEETIGRAGLVAVFVAGALLAAGLLAEPGAGAVAAIAGGYLAFSPRGRVLSALLVPLFFTMVEVPALLLVGLWAVQLVALEGLGGGLAAYAGAFAVALVVVRLVARPRPYAPAPYQVG